MAKHSDYREDVLKALTEHFALDDDIELGQMMGHPAFYCRNAAGRRKMFVAVYGPGIAVKLPPDTIDELLAEPGYEPFRPMGHPMGGWIVASCDDPQELIDDGELLQQAIDYTSRT